MHPTKTLPARAAFALLLSSLCAAAHAADGATVADLTELAKASGCFSCHSVDEKVVGPAFKSVAQKYAGQKGAAADLAQSIQGGSTGKWGRLPMPPHPSLPPADVKRLAEWILTIKP